MLNLKDTKSLRVWAVDDEEDIVDIYHSIFASKYQFRGFLSPKELLTVLPQTEDVPHLIITDINMPEMDGINLIQNVRLIDDSISFVVSSGFINKDWAIKAIKLGGVSVIEKPVEDAILMNAVNEQLFSAFLKNSSRGLMDKYDKFCSNVEALSSRIEQCLSRVESLTIDFNQLICDEQKRYVGDTNQVLVKINQLLEGSKGVVNNMNSENEKIRHLLAS